MNIAVFTTAAFVIVIAQTMLILSAWQYSRQVKNDTGAIHAGAQFELAWTIAPAILLALIFGISIPALVR